jgi:Protein of unknown function (DUF4231)
METNQFHFILGATTCGRLCQKFGIFPQNLLQKIRRRELESRAMATQAMNTTAVDPIMERLEDQISWYDRKSLANQRYFRRIKMVEIAAAALIPFLAAVKRPETTWITGGLGVLITILEGMLHLNQYQQNWIAYRSTCESLKHEKYVYLGKAAPYGGSPDPHALLAERIESLVSQEHAKWASVQQQAKPATT